MSATAEAAPTRQWHWATRTLLTLAIAAAGGLLMNALQLPAGLIMGGAVAVAIAAVAGLPVLIPNWLRDTAFVFTGASMGANVARDSMTMIWQWPASLAGLILELILIIAVTGYMLKRWFKLDAGTAYLSSFPGHLSFIMGIASAGVGDARQIAIIQTLRILLLTVCVPIGAMFLPIQHFAGAPALPPMDWTTLMFLVLGCAGVGLVLALLKVPAGMVLGAMLASTAAKLGGLFDGAMPPVVLSLTFIVVGALIGVRFGGIGFDELKKAVLGGLIATVLTVAIVTVIAWGVSLIAALPFGQIWLGLAPGALEGMGAMGIALGYNTAFIATHHVSRLLLLTLAIPVVAMLVREKS